MRLVPWCLLLFCVCLYLFFGGIIFMVLEQTLGVEVVDTEGNNTVNPTPKLTNECAPCPEIHAQLQEIFLLDLDGQNDSLIIKAAILRLKNTFQKQQHFSQSRTYEPPPPVEPSKLTWNYYNSVVYAFTIVTTIGYGHLTPKTDGSRVFAVFYALIGIPLHMILVRELGEYFSRRIKSAHKFSSKMMVYGNTRLRFILQIIYFLIPGFLGFVILPAGLFVAVENWTFAESFYFAGVSLMTIGFGDFVPGTMHANGSFWIWSYKIFVFIWIEFGLGYLLMVLGFVTRVFLHKNVITLIQKKLLNFLHLEKVTDEELLEDVEFLQSVMGEPFLLKIRESMEIDKIDLTVSENRDRKGSKKSRGGSQPESKRGSLVPPPTQQFLLPNEVLAAVVNVLRHGVIQEVLGAIEEDGEGGQSTITSGGSISSSFSAAEKKRRKILENKRKSLWYLGTLTESVVQDNFQNREESRSPDTGRFTVEMTNEEVKEEIPSVSRIESSGRKSQIENRQIFNEAFGKFSSGIRQGDRYSESELERGKRRQRKIGISSIIEENQLSLQNTGSSNHRKKINQMNPMSKKISESMAHMSRPPTTTTTTSFPSSSRQRHVSLSLEPNVMDDFSRMLNTLHSKLKQSESEKPEKSSTVQSRESSSNPDKSQV